MFDRQSGLDNQTIILAGFSTIVVTFVTLQEVFVIASDAQDIFWLDAGEPDEP